MVMSSEYAGNRPEDPENLPELAARARDGDEAAFGQLVEHFHQRLYNVVFRFVSNRDDAMELTQQVWVKAWTRRSSFRGDSGFFTWLYKIAHFTCIDFHRKRARRPESELNADIQPHLDPSLVRATSVHARPDQEAEHEEVRAVFEAALNELSPEHRMALVLREVEGLSYDEIARAMKCRRGTVMSRLYHARRRIQEYMKDLI